MQYYYSDGENKFGPMSAEDAAARVRENPGGRNYIWKPGMEQWARPADVEDIKALLSVQEVPAQIAAEQQQHTTATPEREASAIDAATVFTEPVTSDEPLRPQVGRNYPRANVGKRFGAYVIDTIIGCVFVIPSVMIFISAIREPRLTFPLLLLSVMLLFPSFIYTFIRDGLGQGQSWGKQLLGLMVVDVTTNEPCTKGKSFVRNFIMVLIAAFPGIGFLIEPIIVLADDKGRRLGDRAADTMVIDVDTYTGRGAAQLRV